MRGETTTDPKRKIAKGRRCYVNLGQGVLIVYKAFLRGVYQTADTAADRKALGRGRVVRVGTYGDPAACPDQRLDGPYSRRADLDRVHASKALAPRYRDAKRGQLRGSQDPLGSGPPDLPRDHRS
jgi:hypothetical protein